MIENMEFVIIQDGNALGMAVLSAEDTDCVCKLLGIDDKERNGVILVADRDRIDLEASTFYRDADWAALNRPNTEDLNSDVSTLRGALEATLRGALEATLTQMRQASKLFENDAEWNQAIKDAEDALNRASDR